MINNTNNQTSNHRNTLQRQTILEVLHNYPSHPTAQELFEQVQRKIPRISLGTVYRNLKILYSQGQIRKITNPGEQTRYDADLHRHYHVRCVCCNCITDLPDLPDALPVADYQQQSGFEITGHKLEFYGICPRCQQIRTAENQPIPKKW
jgi:Fur family ferric uptake transcriptional regulator